MIKPIIKTRSIPPRTAATIVPICMELISILGEVVVSDLITGVVVSRTTKEKDFI